ncbi:MAG: hypothetical protein HQ483_13395 [Rhodospirillales bacterium]|nr:hypothetical protein [Rhodospirillales bacterium]
MIEELTTIADDMEKLLSFFVDSSALGLFLPTEHSTTFKALAIEVKSILDEELGLANDFSMNLMRAVNTGASGFTDGPSYAAVVEASKIVHAAARAIKRKRKQPVASPSDSKPYVAGSRIASLQAIGNAQWDFARLMELCREINVAEANRCHMSTAMLLRSILNHVPPVLGFGTFAEVANNYGGTKTQKSFKASMQRLENSLRNIADMHLHTPIRPSEDVPTATQVDFAADLDVLLGEVIRVSRVAQASKT